MSDYHNWLTLQDLDRATGLPKGSAFRCFKRLIPSLVEGTDFIVLDHQRNAMLAASLHASGRIYRSSIHPVLLAPASAARVRQQLETISDPGSN